MSSPSTRSARPDRLSCTSRASATTRRCGRACPGPTTCSSRSLTGSARRTAPPPSRLLEGRRFWFVGIGGAGMSVLALVARAWGAEVGGSDRARSSYVDRLEEAGIPVTIGHDAANVPGGAEVVVSSAIAPDNPEVAGRDVKRRGELLAELVELRPSIVVAGAHGKTTTAG